MNTQAQGDKMISFRASASWKTRVQRASETKDGGNFTRLVKRAVDKLITEERLLEGSEHAKGETAA